MGGDPKGKNFLYCCGQSVFIRDLKDPLKCEMYNEHSFATTVARYAPSGFYIASGDVSGTVRIWDTTQKEHVLKIELKILSGAIMDLQWSDDSKRIVAVGDGKDKYGAVFLFDSGSSVGEITGHSKQVSSCDFKQTRPYRIATGGEDQLVNWFEGPPFKFHHAMKDHNKFVNCVRFAPNGELLLTVASDMNGYLYDGKTGELKAKLNGGDKNHKGGIYGCAWSPDSRRILTASADKTCKFWDATTGDCISTFVFSDNPQIEHQQLGCLWQGDTVVSIQLNGDLNYLDLQNPNKPLRIVKGHNKAVMAVAFDPTDGSIYSGSYDALIVKWDINTGNNVGMVGKGHTNQINKMVIQGDTLVTAGMDDSIRITSTKTREYRDTIPVGSPASGLAVGKKDAHLIVATNIDSVIVIRNGKAVHKEKLTYQPTSVSLSVDETQIAVGGKDNTVYLYALQGDRITKAGELKAHRGPVTSVAYAPDGQHLASGDSNREIFVWDLAKQAVKIQGWVFHSARINSLAWSPASTHVVSGSLDGHCFIWSIQDPSKRIQIKEAHSGGVNAVLFVDNTTVVSGGGDCTVKSWTVKY